MALVVGTNLLLVGLAFGLVLGPLPSELNREMNEKPLSRPSFGSMSG